MYGVALSSPAYRVLLLGYRASLVPKGPSWVQLSRSGGGAGTEHHLQARAHVRIRGHAARDDQVAQPRVRLARPAAGAARALLQVRHRHTLERGRDVGAHLQRDGMSVSFRVSSLGFHVRLARPAAGAARALLQVRHRHALERGRDVGAHLQRDGMSVSFRVSSLGFHVRLARPAAGAARALLQVRHRHALERGHDVGAHLQRGCHVGTNGV